MKNFTTILNEKATTNNYLENNASTTYAIPMGEFLNAITKQEITLPPFQRIGTAWSSEKVVALAQTLANLESIGCFNIAIVNDKYYLVDGQQRSNALAHILNTLDADDRSIVEDYEALVNVTEFQSFAQMADNFVRINGTSGLTSAQKMKAELLTEIQLENFNRLSWSDAMIKLTSTEKDSKETVLSGTGENEEESIKLQAMSIIKQSKCEELTALLLAMYLNKKRIGKGFTTSAKTNFNGNKDYKGLKGSDISEASHHTLRFIGEYVKADLNATNKKPAFIGLVYYLVLIEKLPLEEVGAFVDYLTLYQHHLFVTPKNELYSKGKQLFHSGESNSFEQFKNRQKTMDTFRKSFEQWKTEPQTEKVCTYFQKAHGLQLTPIIKDTEKTPTEKDNEKVSEKPKAEKEKKQSKQRPLDASILEALEK